MERLEMLIEGENINRILDSLEMYLEITGGMEDIRRAIDTNDLVAMVRAATRALNAIGIPDPFPGIEYLKSAEESAKIRSAGNLHYRNRNYKHAILLYNKALAYAPNGSLEVKLAYSNISDVMLKLQAYQACQQNVEAAQALDCPEFLRVKLERRMTDANRHINQEIMRETTFRTEDMLNYAELDVPRNAEIPCVSTDVEVVDKIVVAANEIRSGMVVALERAFVSFHDEINEYGACYYCHKNSFFYIPCEGCCKALFCSNECRERCLEDYHRIECHIVGHMNVESKDVNQHLNRLATRAAIKMSLKLSWEDLRAASLEMGDQLLQRSSVAEAFDSNNAISMLCYDDQTPVPSDVMTNRSLVCAMTVHWLSRVPGYLPEDEEDRSNAIETLSRIILHLNTTFMRQISIPCSVIDYSINNELSRCVSEAQRNVGWFSFTSKLAHSCEPNLLVLGLNDYVALVALQRIDQGDPLTISYIEHFYDMNLLPCPVNSRIRQKLIFKFMEYTCRCRVCLLEWHSGSQEDAILTNPQQEAYNQYQTAMDGGSFQQKIDAIRAALDELSGSINTIQHRNLYVDLRKTLNICQCAKNMNKGYGCVQSLHPFHDFYQYLDVAIVD